MWTLEYKPKSLNEFVGNDYSEIFNWVKNYKNEKKKSLLLIGPVGVGKTTLCELIAKEMGYNLIETNSSDVRSKKVMEDFFGCALGQQSLFFKGKLVLFDEVDGLSGMYDRGSISALSNIISKSKHPIILTATDERSKQVKDLKKISKVVKFNEVDVNNIFLVLKRICEYVSVSFSERALRRVARSCCGDIRGAINTLESLVSYEGLLKDEDTQNIDVRDSSAEIAQALNVIFNTNNFEIADQVINNIDSNPDEMMQWIRENVCRVYKLPIDVAVSFYYISRADLFRERITSKQYWRYIVYQNRLMGCGVATAKTQKYACISKFVYPQKISVLARSMFDRASRKKKANVLSNYLHCSTNQALKYLLLIDFIKVNDKSQYDLICEQVGLNL
jgi:replication factor C large subunit